jgi:Xaa-Pro aminopeptidase
MLSRYSHIYLDSMLMPSRKKPARRPNEDLAWLIDFIPCSRQRPLAPEVAKLRRIKSEAEIELMRRAADISATAHAKVRATPFAPRWTNLVALRSCYRLCSSRNPVERKRICRPISSIIVRSGALSGPLTYPWWLQGERKCELFSSSFTL